MDLVGIEPTTSFMPWKRAPSCATGPLWKEYYVFILAYQRGVVKRWDRDVAGIGLPGPWRLVAGSPILRNWKKMGILRDITDTE